jgi:hypothetical protein
VRALHKTVGIAVLIMTAVAVQTAAARSKDEKKHETKHMVDSGVFDVIVKGQHVISESFSIEEQSGINIVKAQLKETVGTDPAKQKSELEFTSQGELLRYEWSDGSGGSLTVMPDNDFLKERITVPGQSKPEERPFLMPGTSMILDNNFFIQREILAWRYLALDCKSEGGNLKCQKGPAEFGVLVPQVRTSMSVRLELVGREKVKIRGVERDLLRLNLSGEDYQWSLWLDDQDHFKLMRVAIPADDTEVVRE